MEDVKQPRIENTVNEFKIEHRVLPLFVVLFFFNHGRIDRVAREQADNHCKEARNTLHVPDYHWLLYTDQRRVFMVVSLLPIDLLLRRVYAYV